MGTNLCLPGSPHKAGATICNFVFHYLMHYILHVSYREFLLHERKQRLEDVLHVLQDELPLLLEPLGRDSALHQLDVVIEHVHQHVHDVWIQLRESMGEMPFD